MEGLMFFALIGTIWWCISLSGRVRVLEEMVRGSEPKRTDAVVPSVPQQAQSLPEPAPQVSIPPTEPQPLSLEEILMSVKEPAIPVQVSKSTPPYVPVPVATEPNPFFEWLSQNTLIKIGAFLFFLGAVWFVSYAISQGWISPLMRILLGIATGMAVCVVGVWRRKENADHYLTLTTLGVGIIVASVYAGQFLFHLFSPAIALIILLAAIGFAVVVSVEAKQQWLCILSAITTFLAPLLTNNPEPNPTLFLVYILVCSGAFLAVVFVTNWRLVTLTLTVGANFFLLATYSEALINHAIFWLFVLLFSVLYYTATSVSMFRNNDVESPDVVSLGLAMVALVSWTHELVVLDGLVTFIAALVTAATGYALHVAQRSEKLVVTYAGISATLILIATAFTFDGYALTMVYTFEVACALILGMHLRLPHSVTSITTGVFMLPVLLSVNDVVAHEWNNGVWHGPGVSVYALVIATGAVATYAIMQSRRVGEPLYQAVGGIFISLFWVYACTCAALVWGTLFSGAVDNVLQYMSWAMISSFILVYLTVQALPQRWIVKAHASFLLPIVFSFNSIASHHWQNSWLHPDALGLYFMTVLSLVIGLWLLDRSLRSGTQSELAISGVWLTGFWLYGVVVAFLLWHAVFGDTALANVTCYMTWAMLSYFLVQGAIHFRVPSSWLLGTLVTLVIPTLASFGSFVSSAWATSSTHIDAVGLYALTALLVLLVLGLQQAKTSYQGDKALLSDSIRALWILISLYLITIVWKIAHAVFVSQDIAVSVALFVYTVVGLILYTVGKTRLHDGVRYAGVLLLGGVVARLLIVDVWKMEVLGRIVTFLGVGLLFILTALFEKPFQKFGKKPSDVSVGD